MIQYISGLFYCTLYVFLCEMFASCFLKEYKKKLKLQKIFYMVLWMALCVFLSIGFDQHMVFKFISIIVLNFGFLLILFKSKIHQTIMVAVLYQITCVVSDFLIWCFIQKAVPDINLNKVNDSMVSILAVFLSQTLVSLLIFWLKGIKNSEEKITVQLQIEQWNKMKKRIIMLAKSR